MVRKTTPDEGGTQRRRYSSSRRAMQAAQTRQDVLVAAIEVFAASGWSGTTLAAVAEKAGVAVETIYSRFGSKKGLLHTAMDRAVSGDDEPVMLISRPEFAALTEGPLEQRLRAAARLGAVIHKRSAGVWRAILEAASTDAEVAGWRDEREQNRRADIARLLNQMLGRPVDGLLLDAIWLLNGPEVYYKLVVETGMAVETYEELIYQAGRRLTLDDVPHLPDLDPPRGE